MLHKSLHLPKADLISYDTITTVHARFLMKLHDLLAEYRWIPRCDLVHQWEKCNGITDKKKAIKQNYRATKQRAATKQSNDTNPRGKKRKRPSNSISEAREPLVKATFDRHNVTLEAGLLYTQHLRHKYHRSLKIEKR